MKIKTITCHDVYNLGASLQAYALAAYLQSQGHEVEIIDYQPLYLRHYRLAGVPNPRFDKPFLREAYQIAKFPGRLYDRLTSKRKKAFDRFTAQYLPVTQTKYSDLASLRAAPPEADLYIAGSDQIWNPLFQNGKDPAFFLDFVPEGKRRISYAASFAAEEMSEASAKLMSPWLKKLDAIYCHLAQIGSHILRFQYLHFPLYDRPFFLGDPKLELHFPRSVCHRSVSVLRNL